MATTSLFLTKKEKSRRETDVDPKALSELVFFTQSTSVLQTPVFFLLRIMKCLSPLLLPGHSLGQFFLSGFASGPRSCIGLNTKIVYHTKVIKNLSSFKEMY